MAWAAQQWLRICKETTYNTVLATLDPGSAVEGTDYIWLRLPSNNAFTVRAKPALYTIRSADSGNRPVQTGSGFTAVSGNVVTPMYPSRAGFLLDAALKLTSNDLTSYTLDYFDSQRARRYTGAKVDNLGITAGSDAQFITLNFAFTACQPQTDPTLAQPTATNFPSEQPYLFQDSSTQIKVNNAVISKYNTININFDNKLVATRDETQYISACYYGGRDVTWGCRLQYAANTYRPIFEGVTVMATNQFKLVKGANSVTIDLKSTNYITNVEDDLPIDGAAYQVLTIVPYYDRTATTDFTYTVV